MLAPRRGATPCSAGATSSAAATVRNGTVAGLRRSSSTGLQVVVDLGREVEIVEHLGPAVMDDQRARTVLLDDLGNVRGEDQAAVGALFEHLLLRAALEALVAGGDDLVDQVAVEIDGEGQGEIEPGAHAGRIGAHRLGQEFTELGEIVDVVADVLELLVVD